jgi:hypothetical protein
MDSDRGGNQGPHLWVAVCMKHCILSSCLLGLLYLAACADPAPIRILLFTGQAGEQHESVSVAVAALKKAGFEKGWMVDHLESSAGFTPAGLAKYDSVVFLLTSGDVLATKSQRDAFMHYIKGGCSFVGVHSAAESNTHWDWFGALVGARPVAEGTEAELRAGTALVHDR